MIWFLGFINTMEYKGIKQWGEVIIYVEKKPILFILVSLNLVLRLFIFFGIYYLLNPGLIFFFHWI